jgi:tRNA(Ser,Leu) C12 N-acetylase TAN1
MEHWNVIVTALPGMAREFALLKELNHYGEFHPTQFKDVCIGRVEDTAEFLEAMRRALEAEVDWVRDLARVIPIEDSFRFSPETLAEQLKAAVASFVRRMESGTCYVRLERRGLEGLVMSQEVERAVADHLFALAEREGKDLRASFEDPDYIVAAETLGNECGVVLIDRELRQQYPFVHPK